MSRKVRLVFEAVEGSDQIWPAGNKQFEKSMEVKPTFSIKIEHPYGYVKTSAVSPAHIASGMLEKLSAAFSLAELDSEKRKAKDDLKWVIAATQDVGMFINALNYLIEEDLKSDGEGQGNVHSPPDGDS